MRTYTAVPDHLEIFHKFFKDRLLPVQLRYGARLVGRWQTEDYRVVAVWEYDDRESYERIENQVRTDPDSVRTQAHRGTLPQLFTDTNEVFMRAAPQVD